jgi:hypothetical protein
MGEAGAFSGVRVLDLFAPTQHGDTADQIGQLAAVGVVGLPDDD